MRVSLTTDRRSLLGASIPNLLAGTVSHSLQGGNKRFGERATTFRRPAARPWLTGLAMQPDKSGAEDDDSRWEKVWKSGLAPGERWDMGGPHKALMHLIDSGKLDVTGKTVFVPGCGRGYDPVAIAERGGKVEGMDISESGVAAAKAYLEEYNSKSQNPVQVTYTKGDFFEHQSSYEVGFDYTFFCAIDPSMRVAWGLKWAELMASEGILVVFVFPIKPEKKDGRPWHVDESIATEMLSGGFEVVYEEKIPHHLSHPRRAGFETIMIWKRK